MKLKLLTKLSTLLSVSVLALGLPAVASAKTSTTQPHTPHAQKQHINFKAHDFNALNFGGHALKGTKHLNLHNSQSISNQDLILIPASKLKTLNQNKKDKLRSLVEHNKFVILYKDSQTQISLGDLEKALGYSDPIIKN